MSDRIYFDSKALDDALLSRWVNTDIIKESTMYVESLAESLGVSAVQIATPTPYKISRLAQLFTYMTTAQRKSLFAKGAEADNDSFALKYNMYRQLLKDCESSITALTFTNGVSAKKRRFPMTVSMSRN